MGAAPHVEEVLHIVRQPAVEVVESVVPNGVARFFHHFQHVVVLAHIVADAEKSGLGVVLRKLVEHPRCHFWNGPVIESEVDYFFVRWDSPSEIWEELLDELRCFYQVHKCFRFLDMFNRISSLTVFWKKVTAEDLVLQSIFGTYGS